MQDTPFWLAFKLPATVEDDVNVPIILNVILLSAAGSELIGEPE